ncbi:MAG: hypothetical protein K8S87_09620 [Planctomycetes bacterium]|nr:hypothetical protein [Planctomycetota bacterium]
MVEYEDEYEDEEYEDDEYEEDEYEDDEYDEYEDDEYEDERYDRRYDEDFDAVSAEPEIKTAIGIDGFAIIFSFILLLVASFLLARYSLYEVYDESFLGLIPPKEIPEMNQSFNVESFGYDKSISDVYNYAYIDAGTNQGLERGFILYMGSKIVTLDKEMESGAGDWGICMVVTDDIGAEYCRADIVKIRAPKKDSLENSVRTIGGTGSDSETGNWLSLSTLTSLMKNLNWLLKDENIPSEQKKVRIAKWDSNNQWIVAKIESDYSKSMKKRVPMKKKK